MLFYNGRRKAENAEHFGPRRRLPAFAPARPQLRATCYSLTQTHDVIKQGAARSLLAVPPKEIKRLILPESFEPDNWFPDVWLLTEKDRGTRIEGQPRMTSLLQLPNKVARANSGTQTPLRGEGFEIIKDERSKLSASDAVGASVLHKITTGAAPRSAGSINLAHRRPWQAQEPPLEQLTIDYDVTGKENGLARAQRRQLDAAQRW